ncbi:MAG: cobalamin biosynthesis protein [Burkholderiales bacterium]|nr:cobalamin biosynthesis protein [Burkholderiales bacterium]
MLTALMLAACVALGMLLDLMLGEAKRWHPLVGFGRLATRIAAWLHHDQASRWTGGVAWSLAVLPPVILVQAGLLWAARNSLWLAPVLHAVLLYFCLGLRSLRDHTAPIQAALEESDLASARQRTSFIVSRDTDDADETDLAKASVESLLENGCDAVFGTLFWFVLLGGAGALLYRLSNTLDAMWGYRTPRWLRFGCVAARIDDGLNWIPARLTALCYALLGNTQLALECWQYQAPRWPSPNAGPVMASGAGALELALGGAARYDGVEEIRPPLGRGNLPVAADIARAWRLVLGSAMLWLGAIVLGCIFLSGAVRSLLNGILYA